ncbi:MULTISPECIES: hypothetical protein [unclassified Mesorhizobium]|nr:MULTISPECIES: hypothetical protein [unclassified Mesorhizobium]MDG4901578.1 hypothetical protein [Mesorhizobium sp. WSM4962]MDG4919066.1 hypothetical protein [Mesorhizobium sp. WSM4989]
MLDAIRQSDPACGDSDDHLVELIVMAAVGKTMGVVFDHRSPDERLPRLS